MGEQRRGRGVPYLFCRSGIVGIFVGHIELKDCVPLFDGRLDARRLSDSAIRTVDDLLGSRSEGVDTGGVYHVESSGFGLHAFII